MQSLESIFNTREIAIGIILIAFVSFAFYKDKNQEILKSLKTLLNTFFHAKIIIPLSFMFLYSMAVLYLLNKVGLWENHQIKNFIYWLISIGILTHFKHKTYTIKSAIKNAISLAIIFQFILNFYTFNLLFEILFILLTVFFTTTKLIYEKEENNQHISKFANFILLLLACIIVILTINKYITNFNEFTQTKTFYDFFIPLFLSTMIIPYFYVFFMLVRYETAFVTLNFLTKHDEKLNRYVKLKGLLAFNIDSKNFERWSQNLSSYKLNKTDIEKSIKDTKQLNKIRNNPRKLDIEKGWHPFIANSFLIHHDIFIDEYKKSHDDIWYGYSNQKYIHEENSNLYYKTEGKLECVTKLQIYLNFYFKSDDIEKSYNLFVDICKVLVLKSLNVDFIINILEIIKNKQELEMILYGKTISIKYENYKTGTNKIIFSINTNLH
ncbi:MAG: hypothetical protein CR967_05560 [Proteobacteria bacterium]|nr:MAG: hypothetical protein CR967_05560 [Pseudomonadota bacterium]